MTDLEDLRELANEVPDAQPNGSSASQRLTAQTYKNSCKVYFEGAKDKIEKLIPSVARNVCSSAEDLLLSQYHAAELHLDDAVTVMRNINVCAPSKEPPSSP